MRPGWVSCEEPVELLSKLVYTKFQPLEKFAWSLEIATWLSSLHVFFPLTPR